MLFDKYSTLLFHACAADPKRKEDRILSSWKNPEDIIKAKFESTDKILKNNMFHKKASELE